MKTFIKFVENFTSVDKNLVESIKSAYNMLFESMVLPPKDVPMGVRLWVDSVLGKGIQKYEIEQKGKVHISTPWHEAARVYYQMFQLVGNDATTVDGVSFYRTGLEGDGVLPIGDKVGGTYEIPSGYILVSACTYPKVVRIYTSSDATLMLPPTNTDIIDINKDPNDPEFIKSIKYAVALYQAKALKSPYRTKFNDDIYAKLISNNLMKANKSITVDGINYLEGVIKPQLREFIKNNRDSEIEIVAKAVNFINRSCSNL